MIPEGDITIEERDYLIDKLLEREWVFGDLKIEAIFDKLKPETILFKEDVRNIYFCHKNRIKTSCIYYVHIINFYSYSPL